MLSIDFSMHTDRPRAVSVIGTNDTITVAGQTVAGQLSRSPTAGNGFVNLGVSNLSVQLANTVSLTNGQASFNISSGGLRWWWNRSVVLTAPGITFNSVDGPGDRHDQWPQQFHGGGQSRRRSRSGGHSLTGNFAFSESDHRGGRVEWRAWWPAGINVSIGDAATLTCRSPTPRARCCSCRAGGGGGYQRARRRWWA